MWCSLPVLLEFGLSLFCLMRITDSNYLILSPPELIVYEGDEAVFACSPFMEYQPVVLIRQDLTILTKETEPRLCYRNFVIADSPSLSNRTYTLKDVSREDDSRTFRCVIGDIISNRVTLRVYVPPALRGPSGLIYIMEGSTVPKYFHYEDILGLPQPYSFTWLRDGNPFHGNDRIKLLHMNSTLVVRNSSRADSGEYTLTVVSASGQDSLNLNLIVTYNEFVTSPRNYTAEEGETITLGCRHRFGWAYAWITNRGPISDLGNKVSIGTSHRMVWYGPVDYRDHLLTFTCIVHSVDRKNFFVSSTAVLSVEAPPHISAPMHVSAVENKDLVVILTFRIHSFPAYNSLIFEYNGLSMEFDTRIEANNASILIRNPTKEDAGYYTLYATNTKGTASATINLTVFYAPDIIELDNPIVVQFNRSAEIPCGAETVAHPFPSFQWFRRGQKGISLPNRFSILPQSGVLTVNDAQYEDAGIYICIASNFVGESSVLVNLLVLDAAGPPMNITVLQVGNTWAFISWIPPATSGSIDFISNYAISSVPQPTNYSTDSDTLREAEIEIPMRNFTYLKNSACVEIQCEELYKIVSAATTSVNLTELVPAINYSVSVFVFSNGSNLQSRASQQVQFTTETNVPGIGSVTSTVHGPGSARVAWKLAFSGGHPIEQFHVEYRRNNTNTWIEAKVGKDFNSSILPYIRSLIVHGLEAEEYYLFRVAGSNQLGIGDFRETDGVLLSHSLGVPSPPSKPHIISWNDQVASVTIRTTLYKFGLESNFSLGSILFLDDMEVMTVMGMSLPENYKLGDRIELSLMNVSYRGDLMFSVFASNFLGCSLPSQPSLRARESIQPQPLVTETVGTVLFSLLGVTNAITMVMGVIMCRVMSWESKKYKKSITRRMIEMARDQHVYAGPLSSRSYGDSRSSPDGRSNNLPTTPSESIITEDLRHDAVIPLDSV